MRYDTDGISQGVLSHFGHILGMNSSRLMITNHVSLQSLIHPPLPPPPPPHLPHLSVDDDASLVDVVEPEEETNDGGFASARGTNQRQGGAERHGETQPLQNLILRVVGELDVAKLDGARAAFSIADGKIGRVTFISDRPLLRQQVHHVLHVDKGLLDHAVVSAEHIQRSVELNDVRGEQHVVTHRQS